MLGFLPLPRWLVGLSSDRSFRFILLFLRAASLVARYAVAPPTPPATTTAAATILCFLVRSMMRRGCDLPTTSNGVSTSSTHTSSFHPTTNLLSNHDQKRKRLPTVPLNRPRPHSGVVKGCERSTEVAADRTHPKDKLPSSMSVVMEDESRRNTSFKKENVGKERSTKEKTHIGSSFYEEGPLSSRSTNGEPLQGQDHGKTSHAFCSPFAISCRATYR